MLTIVLVFGETRRIRIMVMDEYRNALVHAFDYRVESRGDTVWRRRYRTRREDLRSGTIANGSGSWMLMCCMVQQVGLRVEDQISQGAGRSAVEESDHVGASRAVVLVETILDHVGLASPNVNAGSSVAPGAPRCLWRREYVVHAAVSGRIRAAGRRG